MLPLLVLVACDRSASPPAPPPSTAELIAHETELLRLTLTPEAVQRLGIQIAVVEQASQPTSRQVTGEIVAPASGGGVPTGSRSDLQLMGAQQAAADAEIARATAQAALARTAFERSRELVAAEAGSAKARDEAETAAVAADAALAAARAQRTLLGPAVQTLNDQTQMWVRVSVFASDLSLVSRTAPAQVRPLGRAGSAREARPVRAAPSANAVTGTVDLYYTLANPDRSFQLGQRVAVDLPQSGESSGPVVPSSALLRDIHGGEWVYVRTAPNTYVRQRVEVRTESNGRALLARGPTPGTEVVTAGAAELFGTEFGAAH